MYSYSPSSARASIRTVPRLARPPPLILARGLATRGGGGAARALAIAAHAQTEATQDPTTNPTTLDIEVDSADAARAISFTLAPSSADDGAAVLVERVLPGSEPERLGVRSGDRLRGLSDPVRERELWTVGARPSLSRIRDAIRMRRAATVRLVFEQQRRQEEQEEQQRQSSTSSLPPPLPSSSAESSLDSLLGTSVDEEDGGGGGGAGAERSPAASPLSSPARPVLTIGERMAARQAAALEASRGLSERQARRRAYLSDQDERAISGGGGSRFLLAAAAAFVLPAAVILAVAYTQGLLDPGRFLGP